MFTVQEIKDKAVRQFKEILKTLVIQNSVESLFPLAVRGCTLNPSKELRADTAKIDSVIKNSRNKTGKGYLLVLETVNTRTNGLQTVIKQVQFENLKDYLEFTGLKKQFDYFEQSVWILRKRIRDSDVDIEDWCLKHISELCNLENEKTDTDYWNKICECVNYLRRNTGSNLYLRQLPLSVHTKFIEENKAVIHSLITEEKITVSFEEAHGLRQKPNLIRFRSLCGKICVNLGINSISNTKAELEELSLTAADFYNLKEAFTSSNVKTIFVVENEIVYLAFPSVQNALCIWGHGYTSSVLQRITWLKDFNLIYFGDLDEHGFDILSKFRTFFPAAKSLCMNKEILQKYGCFRTKGKSLGILENQEIIKNLTGSEIECLKFLLQDSSKDRLEQEHIDNETILAEINSLQAY